jgi:hypothetical protein
MTIRHIQLVHGRGIAIVDGGIYSRLAHYRWYFVKGYARRVVSREKLRRRWRYTWRYMHHDVVGVPESGFEVDHDNGNKLDNRKENLKFVTRDEQMLNWHGPTKRCRSGTLGVSFDKSRGLWRASIMTGGEKRERRFSTKQAAIRQRAAWAAERG